MAAKEIKPKKHPRLGYYDNRPRIYYANAFTDCLADFADEIKVPEVIIDKAKLVELGVKIIKQ